MRSGSPDKSFPSVTVAPPLRYDPAAVADDTAPDAGVVLPASQGIHDEYIGAATLASAVWAISASSVCLMSRWMEPTSGSEPLTVR
jgi:hypothetical protein